MNATSHMQVTTWMRKKTMNRLVKIENLNISKREKRIKRTAMWALVALLAWVVPFTTEYTETIVIENVYAGAGIEPENAAVMVVGTDEDGVGVEAESVGESLEAKISKAFPDNAEEAIKIATCESNLTPDRIGDLHLPVEIGGETLGYSYGVFQIRSGGKDVGGAWSRPAKEGMSLAEWAKKMLDPDENIREAKKIFDKGGWGPWSCSRVLMTNAS